MADQRARRAKLNIAVSLLGQFVTLVCGLIVPRLLIGQFGSEAYGATASIAQFLAYITLLEAGIGGVARAALYKPLAENDVDRVSAVVYEITTAISMVATALNTVLIVILTGYHCSLITVKLVSSVVFALKPFAMWIYVQKHFQLRNTKQRNPKLLEQKWNGLGQHLAFFLHSNTDIAVLTVLADLTTVAVYSVYHMVVAQIQNVTASFSSGMEAIFGDMLAKKETEQLKRTFRYYETLLSFISLILFSVTAVMIVPFVNIYTQ